MSTKKEAIEPKSNKLRDARRNKKDEFYTLLPTIEKELQHYKEHFKGKAVYCNCDQPSSNFVKYFTQNLDELQLKEFIHSSSDFRSPDNLKLLELSDIVVTNPPFSLFREYLLKLIEYNKQFIILGNNNAITYKELFPFIKDGSMWLGTNSNKTVEFELHEGYEKWNRIDEEGKKYGKVPAISWFTNLDHEKRNEPLILTKTYEGNEHDYPNYDNYDAIEVSRVANIPMDFNGLMGVPITFLDKYCPDQFEIIGLDRYTAPKEVLVGGRVAINGKPRYARILIKRK